MKINKRALVVLMSILILLFMFLMLNLNNIGRQPELYSVSNSVVSPGDTITIYGNYFGGELSKGRVYINNKMVFNDFILSWSKQKIVLTLSDDFKSGDITVNNMFGVSNSYLITSKLDVPGLTEDSKIFGYPVIDNLEIIDAIETKVRLTGKNFGSENSLSYLYFIDDDGKETLFDRDYIISWRDDYIEFYLPFNTAGRYVVLSSPKGNSNKYKIPVINKNLVTYSYENPMSYNLKQSVVLDNIVALKGSYINLFMPAVYRGLNQQSIKINSNNGVYNSDSNTVDIIIPIKDSGVSITTNLTSSLIVYNLKSVINKSSVVYRYDKKFPEYIRGFKDSPDVNSLDNDLYQTAKWLVRNSRNRYDQAQIIIEWINKYVKLNPTGSDVSEEIFKKREGSGIGLVNLAVSMIRSIGIPAIVVKGVKTSDTTNVYQWLEFYLVGGVWVPVDMLELYSNSSYEIGNINNNCIAFSKGVTMIKYQSENYRQDLYALQNCVDSFDGNIESYRAVWHNVIIE